MSCVIGFAGLGNMGTEIVKNLLKAGHTVRMYNRTASATEPLVALGATAVSAPVGLSDVDLLITMVLNEEVQRAVIVDSGLLEAMSAAGARKGDGGFYTRPIHVSCVTVSVKFSQEQAVLHAAHGIEYVGMPVVGRPDAAAKAQLMLLYGGSAEVRRLLEPLFVPTIGRALQDCGTDAVKASIMKISFNMTLFNAVDALSEGCALVEKYGIAPETYLSFLTEHFFNCPMYNSYANIMSSHRYVPAGASMTGIGLKDTRLALEAGEQAGVPLRHAALLRDSFMEGIANGMGDWDVAALSILAERRAGIDAQKP